MTLLELLADTGEHFERTKIPYDTSVQVFCKDENRAKYFALSDYLVSSSVSGPSLILIPRTNYTKGF